MTFSLPCRQYTQIRQFEKQETGSAQGFPLMMNQIRGMLFDPSFRSWDIVDEGFFWYRVAGFPCRAGDGKALPVKEEET